MSGTPTLAEIQTQWRAIVDMLEDLRNHVDGTIAGAGGQLDVLMQSLEGEYTPSRVANAAARLRAALSSTIEPARVREFLDPVLLEYARFMGGEPYVAPATIVRELYEYFVANSLTVESRAITYDTSATSSNPSRGGTIIGSGAVSRLTLDSFGFTLEACKVEKKIFRCRKDKNTGAQEHAEEFDLTGAPASQDSILLPSFGSGLAARITALHAGNGAGGSILNNSSFDTYSASASPKFTSWTESAGGANISQVTATTYRGFPGSGTAGSLRINGGSGIVTLKQAVSAMKVKQLDPEQPYFFRVMVNPATGTASGGNFIIRLGSVQTSLAIASMSAGWQEVIIALDKSCWPREFNEDTLDVEIEWDASSASGYLLVDDAILAPFTLFDGTYWVIRQNHATPVSWAVDDTLTFTDTGGAPATAKIQYWLQLAGLGYLPSTTGSPTFTEP